MDGQGVNVRAHLADRDMLKLTQQEFSGLPQHLKLELAVATVLTLIGELIRYSTSSWSVRRCAGA